LESRRANKAEAKAPWETKAGRHESEAIVRSATINEIAEASRND
jgi:hypothetical protein